jgi:phage gpG-like protein
MKRRRKGARIYGANPSAPGEPPRKQTGRLRASVTYEVEEASLTARVGTNVEYGKYLELGTKKGIAPRPWLRRALAECRAKIDSILAQMGDRS